MMKLLTWALPILMTTPTTAEAQETKLDYVAITKYLAQKYGSRCADHSSGSRRSYTCTLAGTDGIRLPYVEVRVSDDSTSVDYSLTVRVAGMSEIASYNSYYLETVAAIDEWGRSMSSILPDITTALSYCFKNSELGKNNRSDCRHFEKITDTMGVGFWGTGSSAYYGFELILKPYKSK